jgi:hypothetical protein
MLTINIL